MEKEQEEKMEYKATLLLTGDANRGIEIKVTPLIGFDLMKYLQGVLSWSSTSEDMINVHKIYLEFAKYECNPKDEIYCPTDFVYEIKTYDGNIEVSSEKRFQYDADMCYEELEAWAKKKIFELSGNPWTPAKVKWLKDNYDMTPEDWKDVSEEDLSDYLEEFFNRDSYMQWSPAKVKWLEKHYNMTPKEAEALHGEELSRMLDELFELEAENYDNPEGNIIANIADILNEQEKERVRNAFYGD